MRLQFRRPIAYKQGLARHCLIFIQCRSRRWILNVQKYARVNPPGKPNEMYDVEPREFPHGLGGFEAVCLCGVIWLIVSKNPAEAGRSMIQSDDITVNSGFYNRLVYITTRYTWKATPSLFTTALPPLANPVPSLRISTKPGFGAFSLSFFFLPSLASGIVVRSASQT